MFDELALSRLLRSTGKTAVQIATAMNETKPEHARSISSQKVDAWVRGKSRPRDDVRAWLADALNIPRATLFAACAGTTPDPSPLHAVTGRGLPVELCYHPDADPGNGRGWSVLIGDRTTFGDLDTMLARVAVEVSDAS
jgi:hypothetical protein